MAVAFARFPEFEVTRDVRFRSRTWAQGTRIARRDCARWYGYLRQLERRGWVRRGMAHMPDLEPPAGEPLAPEPPLLAVDAAEAPAETPAPEAPAAPKAKRRSAWRARAGA